MPDLNLLDDNMSFEEESSPAPVSPKKAKPKKIQQTGGGGSKIVLIILIVILVAGALVYFLNQRGIIKLWGKKQPVVTEIDEEMFPPYEPQQEYVQTELQQQPQTQDSAELALLDTSSVQLPSDETKNVEEKEKKELVPLDQNESLSSMEGEYTIQVIAFKERKRAEEIMENLQEAGYPAFVEQISMRGGAWYRVCIGRYPSRDEASRAVKGFGAQLQTSYIIDKVQH